MTTTTRWYLLAIAMAGTPLSGVAAAPDPVVTATLSGYTAIGSGAIPQSEWVPIATTRNDGPLHAEVSGDGGSFISTPIGPGLSSYIFTSASAEGFAAADPGSLHLFGGVLAIAQGAIIGPNLPPAPNTATVYTNVQVGASFTDYLTVGMPGQAVGTPVDVPFHYAVELVSNYTLGYPFYSAHAIGAAASFRFTGFGDQNFSTESAYFPWTRTQLPNGNGLYTIRSDEFFVPAHVGDVLTVSAYFSIFGQANITDFNRQSQWGGFVDGRNTAGVWLGSLPQGMTITSASGHDYRIDPTAPVPVPAALPLLASALGWLALRRRSRHERRRDLAASFRRALPALRQG